NLLSTFPQVTITVVAHTDAVGDEDANLRLSQRRANAVRDYWVDRGVEADRIITDARGESDLLVPTDGPELANRRVEFIVTGLLDG
ncbi:MAG: OmpA family protein, partial [Actinomycetota bacterium]